ncbi:MAG: ankyrin repeat domain-containing protein [Gammaproteobacteria bacterium]|nr:ankyrin repeat domain-containing protein [Gammaproteobacteria bacterium]MDH5799409.1 ankyrin repeat domain-containing protein [Gammaproteobacteria bacterium]
MQKFQWFFIISALMSALTACSGERYTELMNASRDGDEKAVRRILDAGANVNEQTTQGKTALMLAASNNHLGTVKLLIGRDANFQTTDSFGTTALIVAATAGREKTASYLAELGSDTLQRDSSGGSALGNAVFFGHSGTVAALLKHTPKDMGEHGKELLLVAAGLGHVEIVKNLLKHGVDPNARGIKDRTALMATAAFDKEQTAQILLENGADPALRDADGYSAMDIAKDKNSEKVSALLKKQFSYKKAGNKK